MSRILFSSAILRRQDSNIWAPDSMAFHSLDDTLECLARSTLIVADFVCYRNVRPLVPNNGNTSPIDQILKELYDFPQYVSMIAHGWTFLRVFGITPQCYSRRQAFDATESDSRRGKIDVMVLFNWGRIYIWWERYECEDQFGWSSTIPQ